MFRKKLRYNDNEMLIIISATILLLILIFAICNLIYCIICQNQWDEKMKKKKHTKNYEDYDDDYDDDDDEGGRTEEERAAKRRRKKQKQREKRKKYKFEQIEIDKNSLPLNMARMLATTTTKPVTNTTISPSGSVPKSPTELLMNKLMSLPTEDLRRLIELNKELDATDVAKFGIEVARLLERNKSKSKHLRRVSSEMNNKEFVKTAEPISRVKVQTSPQSQANHLKKQTTMLEDNLNSDTNMELMLNQLSSLKKKDAMKSENGLIVQPPTSTKNYETLMSNPAAKEVSQKLLNQNVVNRNSIKSGLNYKTKSTAIKRRPSISHELCAKQSKSSHDLRRMLNFEQDSKASTIDNFQLKNSIKETFANVPNAKYIDRKSVLPD